MSYLEHESYKFLEKASEDRKFMTSYFTNIISSNRFKGILKKGVSNPGHKRQEFENEIFATWGEYLIDTGRALPSEKSIADKWSVAREAFDVLSGIKDIEFKIIDSNKYVGAIREKDVDYEVSVTRHTKPVVEPGKIEVAQNLKDFISVLGDGLSNSYSVVRIKNNMVTVEDDNKNQTTVKITRKKVKLF